MRISLIARAGIVVTVVALAMSTVHAKEGKDPGDVLAVGTVGNGTAQELAIPDLGTLRAHCSGPAGLLTLDGGAPFLIYHVDSPTIAGFGPLQTTWNSELSFGDTLWLSNVQRQWKLEFHASIGTTPSPPCRVGAVITRIS
jgi:hypothetical protein